MIEQQMPVYTWKPTMDIPVVRDTDSGRIGSMIRWGLVPFWAKDLKKTPVINNACAVPDDTLLALLKPYDTQRLQAWLV